MIVSVFYTYAFNDKTMLKTYYFLQMYGPSIFTRPSVKTLALVGFYIIYLVLGAAVFSAIEGPEESQMVIELRRSRSNFLKKNPCVSGEFRLIYLPSMELIKVISYKEQRTTSTWHYNKLYRTIFFILFFKGVRI